MSVISKNVVVSLFGTVNITCDVHGALAPRTRNVQVCTGVGTEHAPVRITTQTVCPECGIVHVAQTNKAREVADGFVVLTAEDLADVRTDSAAFKKSVALTPHDARAVDLGTVPGEKSYWLAPVRGNEQAYGLLARLLDRHPELSFLGRFTPRTAMAVFSLHAVREGETLHLLMRERVSAEQLATAPSYVETAAPQQFDDMAEQVLGAASLPFDMAAYRDTSAEKLDALVAARAVVTGGTPAMPTPGHVSGALAALQGAFDALTPEPVKPVRKRAPRKTAAKKVTTTAAKVEVSA